MKKVEIKLEEYLKLGGKLEKVDWNGAYSEYVDKNQHCEIVSYVDNGETNNKGDKLINFTFSNGMTHRYSVCWIKVKVELVLADSYL